MTDSEIHPFFFPTTVALVDDSAEFLSNLCLELDPKLAFRLFQSPARGLEAINESDGFPSPVRRFFSLCTENDRNMAGSHLIEVCLDSIHKEIYNRNRFAQISVVVVDFDMPMMDGLEFCRRIGNRLIKKILLTGEADEGLAVNAFNEGIIDAYIRKQDAQAMATLNRAIVDMQQIYFLECERTLSEVLTLGAGSFWEAHTFLRDKPFVECFRKLCEELGIVEYYLCSGPDGMLMADAAGTPYRLVVHTAAQWTAHYESASRGNAPPELLEAMFNGEVVPYFWKTGGEYSPAYQDGQPYLYPSQVFMGEGDNYYIYALIRKPAGFDSENILAYRDHLVMLDKAFLKTLIR